MAVIFQDDCSSLDGWTICTDEGHVHYGELFADGDCIYITQENINNNYYDSRQDFYQDCLIGLQDFILEAQIKYEYSKPQREQVASITLYNTENSWERIGFTICPNIDYSGTEGILYCTNAGSFTFSQNLNYTDDILTYKLCRTGNVLDLYINDIKRGTYENSEIGLVNISGIKINLGKSRLTDESSLKIPAIYDVKISSLYQFTYGAGTEADPYQVRTAEDLNGIRDYALEEAYFKQMADIDLSEYADWEPIGKDLYDEMTQTTSRYIFNGHYKGQSHSVSRMAITQGAMAEVFSGFYMLLTGLFGYVRGSLDGINLVDYDINLVSAAYARVNTLAIGNSGTITMCSAQGVIDASAVTSAFISGLTASEGQIENCFSKFSFNASSSDDIISGISYQGSAGLQHIFNCYTIAIPMEENAGIFIGVAPAEEDMANINYYNSDFVAIDPDYSTGYGVPKTTAEMKQQSTYVGWDFDTVWGIDPAKNDGYPYLRVFESESLPYDFQYGSGTELDPYQVWTAEDLDGVRDYLDAYFIQMADIDLSGYENWTPIGSVTSEEDIFAGSYDGNGYSISNLISTQLMFAGLFGIIWGSCVIKNIAIVDCDITSNVMAGGLSAGVGNGVTIRNCMSSGVVTVNISNEDLDYTPVGGLIGLISPFIGVVYDEGIIPSVENCFSTCSVSATNSSETYGVQAGGLIGVVDGYYSENTNPPTDRRCSITNCYSMGLVTATSAMYTSKGGLVAIDWDGIYTSCYYDSELSGCSDTDKGTPKTTAEMKQQATYIGWDFDTIWGIDPAKNDGYPYLRVFESESLLYDFQYGSGTEADPYQIWNADDLNGVRDYIDDTSVYFIQMTDIDSSGVELVSISEDNYNWNDYQITNITSGLYTFTIADNEATITAYDTSGSGDITIPNTLGGYPVVAIGANAFLLCADLTSITIPATVTSIGLTAFAGCTSLTSLIVNSGNTTYKSASDGAIYNSDYTTLIAYPCGLNTFTIPSTVTKLEQGSFAVGLISEIIIPTNVINVGYACFAFCMSLTKITFMSPNTVIYDDIDTIPQLSTLTIYGLSPSTAKNHAVKYTIPFVELYFSNLIRHYLTKIEWLNWAEDTILGDYTTDAIEGSLIIDSANDVRRTFNATMNNSASLYIPNGARTNMGVKVRIKKGIITSTGNLWWNRGIFVLSDPSAVHSGAEKTVSLNGVDKWALFDGSLGGKITDTTVIAIGTNVADAIRAVAEDVGETKFAFDVCTAVTPYTITREVGDTVADLLKELALIPSWDLYYDVDGYLRFTPIIDPQQKQIVADLSVGGVYRKCYVSSEYNPEWSKIKNYWKIIGYSDPDTGIIYDGVAQDNNHDSPTNTDFPPNGIGKKADIITDTNLTTDSLCSQRAAYELRKNLTKIDRSSHSIIPLPFLNEGDCVQLEDSNTGIDDYKYEIQSITEPFGLDLMKIECWRCSSVFEIVAYDDFQLGVGDWLQLESGSIDIYAFAGNNCLRKTTNDDPNGGYRLLDKTCTDFELVVYTRRDVEGTGYNSYSVVDSSGNGYGISLDYSLGILLIDSRTAWVRTPLDYNGNTFSLGEWYTLRLNKLSSNFIAEIYAGKTLDFSSPLATVSVYDTTTTSFDRVAVNGGNVFYSDDVTVRKLL